MTFCSSEKSERVPALKKAFAVSDIPTDVLERVNVQQAYDQIAGHFDTTRTKPWPVVSQFLEQFSGELVLDCGAGNGRNIIGLEKQAFALDFCFPLCQFASKNCCAEVVCGDALKLPFKDNSFDSIISIAVIHHFASPERRMQAIKEMGRVLRSGGRGMICVWAFRDSVPRDSIVPWTQQIKNDRHHLQATEAEQQLFSNANPLLSKEVVGIKAVVDYSANQEQQSPGEIISTADKGGKQLPPASTITSDIDGPTGQVIVQTARYYHFFEDKELEQLVKEAGLTVDKAAGQRLWQDVYKTSCGQSSCYLDSGNWYCIFTK